MHYLKKYTDKYLAWGIIYFLDLSAVFLSYMIAAVLRFNFDWELINFNKLLVQASLTAGIYALSFGVYKSYRGIIRYSSISDIQTIVVSGFLAWVLLFSSSLIMLYAFGYYGIFFLPNSILIVQFLIVVFVLSFGRLFVRAIYSAFLNPLSRKSSSVG
jgi:FlaA1/EpsC-like NDP-sugar epimerase